MDIATLLMFGVPALIYLWLALLGSVAARYDSTLDPFQRKAQMAIAWLIPFFGAALVLHLVQQHSPDAIPRSLMPWPFRSLIYGKPRPRHKERDDNEENGVDLAGSIMRNGIGSDFEGGSD
ncbi:MAG: hypothetical protein MI754_18225 [Chromatiales bacterium]|nr:hypothetical protein [Chromatiales bacterium]